MALDIIANNEQLIACKDAYIACKDAYICLQNKSLTDMNKKISELELQNVMSASRNHAVVANRIVVEAAIAAGTGNATCSSPGENPVKKKFF